MLDFYKDAVVDTIEHADFVFCNEHEASKFAANNGLEATDRVGAAKMVASFKKANNKRPRYAIMT